MGALTRRSRELIAERSVDPAWFQDILDTVADGGEIYKIAIGQGLTYRSLMQWIKADEVRNQAFQEAQAIGAQKLVDKALDTAENFEDGQEFRAKLKIDTYLKIAGKLDQRFGNGPNVAVSGTNIQVVMTDFSRTEPEGIEEKVIE